ncbi:DUF2268 domain-containing protein [Streptomyces sp. NPDC051561]|uniref:DUF2268 domain-containing protein n=1 Tax=Streptomyces sp. NPDC051561 TaxID=3365658 RepID=UPI0037B1FFE1
MKIVVHDTATAMLELLQLPPQERPEALRTLLAPLQEAMAAVGAGEVDVVQMHTMTGSGFPLDGEDPRLAAAVRQLRDAGVWERIEQCLATAAERLAAEIPAGTRTPDTVHVLPVLGNPDDHHLTVRSSGYFGLGGFPGAIHLTIWPTDISLERIGHAAAHELHHNVRYANVVWNPATVTVGEQVVAEGLAEAFVRDLAGEHAMAPWTTGLKGKGLDEAYAKIVGGIDVAGMQNLTAYVHGDATAELMGQQPVGLADFAGYGVGLRIADAHTAASGLSAAASVALPPGEVLAHAGVPGSTA